MAEWSEADEEVLRMTSKKLNPSASTASSIAAGAGVKQHRKVSSVMTASYLQPTVSSSGSAAAQAMASWQQQHHLGSGGGGGGNRSDSVSPLPPVPSIFSYNSNNSSSTGYGGSGGSTPSFMQPTQAVRARSNTITGGSGSKGATPKKGSISMSAADAASLHFPSGAGMGGARTPRRRKESRAGTSMLVPGGAAAGGDLIEEGEEGPSVSPALNLRHKRVHSIEEPAGNEEDEAPSPAHRPAGGSRAPSVDKRTDLSRPTSLDPSQTPTPAHASMERANALTLVIDPDPQSMSSASTPSAASLQPQPATPLPITPSSTSTKRTPWQPSILPPNALVSPASTTAKPAASAPSAASNTPLAASAPAAPLHRSTPSTLGGGGGGLQLTEEELAHQAELDRVRAENARRKKKKEEAALLEAQRLQALANDPAEQLRLRRQKRKDEFRNRKAAEQSAEEARKAAEAAAQRAEEEARRKAQEEREQAEAERLAAQGRLDMERRIAERMAREQERKALIIEEFERKRAEEVEARRVAEEAERIANIPKYLATGTVAAAARMLELARAGGRGGEDVDAAEEYLEKMRARSEVMRENAAQKRRELELIKLNTLHTRDEELAAHIAEIRRNKAELFESEQAELELATLVKERRAAENLRQIQLDSDADLAAKHAELQQKIKAAQAKVHASEAERHAELEEIYREHEEEARRKADMLTAKLEALKADKARENELQLLRARSLKEQFASAAEDDLRALVEAREQMRDQAAQKKEELKNALGYTPKVGIDYMAEHDMLHLAGLPASHPMMLAAGISRIDEASGQAVWQAQGSHALGNQSFQVTNVGSGGPASFVPAAAGVGSAAGGGVSDRSGLDSGRGGPGSPGRPQRYSTFTGAQFSLGTGEEGSPPTGLDSLTRSNKGRTRRPTMGGN